MGCIIHLPLPRMHKSLLHNEKDYSYNQVYTIITDVVLYAIFMEMISIYIWFTLTMSRTYVASDFLLCLKQGVAISSVCQVTAGPATEGDMRVQKKILIIIILQLLLCFLPKFF